MVGGADVVVTLVVSIVDVVAVVVTVVVTVVVVVGFNFSHSSFSSVSIHLQSLPLNKK